MTFFPDGTANVVIAGPGPKENLPERAWYLSEHHLVGRESCGVVQAPGWSDYTDVPVTHQWFETARGDGAIWLGAVVEPNEFSIPVYVHKTQGRPFADVDDSFWSDIDPFFQSRLYVNTPRSVRFCDFRLADKPKVVHDEDPAFEGFQPYLIPVVVEKSWWFGLTETFSWKNGQPTKKRFVHNSGDRKAAPIWILQGPGVFQLPDGQGETTVTTPNLKAGEIVVIHTDMSVTPKSNMRSNFFGDMGGQRFRTRLPGRRSLKMDKLRCIGGNAVSSAVCQVEPKSRRPF